MCRVLNVMISRHEDRSQIETLMEIMADVPQREAI